MGSRKLSYFSNPAAPPFMSEKSIWDKVLYHDQDDIIANSGENEVMETLREPWRRVVVMRTNQILLDISEAM